MDVKKKITDGPKTIKCGDHFDYVAEIVIESEPCGYDDWRPNHAINKARNDLDRYIDKYKAEVEKAAKKWEESVKCRGSSDNCPSGKCKLDIKIASGGPEAEFKYEGALSRRGNVVCVATITSTMRSAHCDCIEA